MIIYQSKLGIKIVGKGNEYNEEIEREYGKRNLFITDEKNFKKFHFCINEKYNYWLPNQYKNVENIYEQAKEAIEKEEQWQENCKKQEAKNEKIHGR